MKLVLKYTFAILSIIVLISFASIVVCAEHSYFVASGVCGEDATWTLYELYNPSGYELVISGTGAMTAYSEFGTQQPWYSYRNSIKSVTIENGVTTIGNYACNNK